MSTVTNGQAQDVGKRTDRRSPMTGLMVASVYVQVPDVVKRDEDQLALETVNAYNALLDYCVAHSVTLVGKVAYSLQEALLPEKPGCRLYLVAAGWTTNTAQGKWWDQ